MDIRYSENDVDTWLFLALLLRFFVYCYECYVILTYSDYGNVWLYATSVLETNEDIMYKSNFVITWPINPVRVYSHYSNAIQ